MSNNMFYNVGKADISNGLTDFEISSGQDYFILLSAPSNANVQVRLNENTAPQIPIKEFWQFKSKDVKRIYLSADSLDGEVITWGQADGNLEITTNPTIDTIDTITQMGGTFAEQMDKIINPYDMDNISISSHAQGSTSSAIILKEVLDCDKIEIIGAVSFAGFNSEIVISLNGHSILYLVGNSTTPIFASSKKIILEGVRGLQLTASSTYYGRFTIRKFNLKA